MNLEKIPAGKDVPNDVYAIIENPMGAAPVKYEMDKDSGAIFVDRFIHTSMMYPGNYGFIPHTLSGDGDPADVLVLGQLAVMPGAVLRCRPIGVLEMEDDGGMDEKIICVPVSKLHPYYDDVENLDDLPAITKDVIQHFFEHYKDLEKGKWVKTKGWGDAAKAKQLIVEAVERAGGKAAA